MALPIESVPVPNPMTFPLFFAILRARWRSAALVLLLTIGGTVAVTLLMPRTYTASASLVLDVRSPDPILGMTMGAMAMPAYMATQVEVLQSERVALRVVQGLRMADNAQIREQWRAETGGQGSLEAWLAQMIGKKLDVKPSREGNVIYVSYANADPKFAAALANAFARAYIDISLGLRTLPAQQYADFFGKQAQEVREALEKAQQRLAEAQRQHGITVADERFDIETQRLNELSSQLVMIQAQAADSSSRSAQVQASGDRLQDVIANPVVAGLRADLSRQEARFGELGARLGDAHPQVIELRANIEELRRRIDSESRRVGGSVGVTNSINRQREAEARAALEAQRAKVLHMKEQRGELTALQRDVESLQRSYEQISQRVQQTSLESQATQTNISLLSSATEPTQPSSPRLMLNTLLSVFLGILLAVAFVLVREVFDRRVRLVSDFSDALCLPVLGVLPGEAGPGPGSVLSRLVSPQLAAKGRA
ncbi:MAG: hypothetical protein RLZZ592_93 [Pseudomonadota bacterium]|jgi:chain length determinant protein EpsF